MIARLLCKLGRHDTRNVGRVDRGYDAAQMLWYSVFGRECRNCPHKTQWTHWETGD
jgi:hypothetical protein